MNLELYKNLGNCFSRKLKFSDYEYFSFAFFQAPRSRQVAASAVAGALQQQQRTRVQTSAASRCRLLLLFCLFCFFRGVCVCFWMHSASSSSLLLLFCFFCFWETQEQILDLTSHWHPQVKLIDRGPAGVLQLALHWVWTRDLFWDLKVPNWATLATHHWCGNFIMFILGYFMALNCQLAVSFSLVPVRGAGPFGERYLFCSNLFSSCLLMTVVVSLSKIQISKPKSVAIQEELFFY